MKIALVALALLHGLIHFMGFLKAFKLAEISQLTLPISKPAGIVWLLAAVLFGAVASAVLARQEWWWLVAAPALIVSQVLICLYWQDAKFGTIANLIILLAAISAYSGWSFHRSYVADIRAAMAQETAGPVLRISAADLQSLPEVVQRYLRYVGVLDRNRLSHIKLEFSGEMRGKGKKWFSFRSQQYNFFTQPTRLFFMRGRMFGLSIPGYHAYKNGTASMIIKLFALIPVADYRGPEMDTAETVTVFNDMCLMAPATLIDPRITWLESDESSARAAFSLGPIRITAQMLFNAQGQLVNFISDDRYDVSGGTPVRLRWSTPVRDYRNINGVNVPTYGETVWHYPDGEFCYGRFHLDKIEYNGASE